MLLQAALWAFHPSLIHLLCCHYQYPKSQRLDLHSPHIPPQVDRLIKAWNKILHQGQRTSFQRSVHTRHVERLERFLLPILSFSYSNLCTTINLYFLILMNRKERKLSRWFCSPLPQIVVQTFYRPSDVSIFPNMTLW